MTEPRRPDPPPPPTVSVDQQTKFYGQGEEYVNAQGIRYRKEGRWWKRLPDPPKESPT
jgi:hypothetical protein